MAGPFNLSGSFISNTFQRLLQISGSNNVVLDGTGSIVILALSGSFDGTHTGDGSGLTGITASAFVEIDPVLAAISGSFATTASNQFVGDQGITGSLNVSGTLSLPGITDVSASIAALDVVSGSLSDRVTLNEQTGSSLVAASSSFSTRVTNLEQTSSDLVNASASFSTRVTNNEQTSSNLVIASSSFSNRVTTLEEASSSFASDSGSNSTRLTNLEISASEAANNINDLNNVTGSYATTASNTFIGDQTITGSVDMTGNMSASSAHITGDVVIKGRAFVQELHTTYQSASIIYSSGSTKFGDTDDDIHAFTGSIANGAISNVSASIANNIVNIANLQADSGSFSTRVTTLEQASSSFASDSASFSTRITNNEQNISNLSSVTGSYATTGSNIFKGDQTITGSLIMSGGITGSAYHSVTDSMTFEVQQIPVGPAQPVYEWKNAGFTIMSLSNTGLNVGNPAASVVLATRAVFTSDGLTGGGFLSSDKTFGILPYRGIVTSSNGLAVDESFDFIWSGSHTFISGTSFASNVNISGTLTLPGISDVSQSISNLSLASASFSDRVTSNETSINILSSITGSYATTGSNHFSGSQTITGSVHITGDVTGSTFSGSALIVDGIPYYGERVVFVRSGSLYNTSSTPVMDAYNKAKDLNPTFSDQVLMLVPHGTYMEDIHFDTEYINVWGINPTPDYYKPDTANFTGVILTLSGFTGNNNIVPFFFGDFKISSALGSYGRFNVFNLFVSNSSGVQTYRRFRDIIASNHISSSDGVTMTDHWVNVHAASGDFLYDDIIFAGYINRCMAGGNGFFSGPTSVMSGVMDEFVITGAGICNDGGTVSGRVLNFYVGGTGLIAGSAGGDAGTVTGLIENGKLDTAAAVLAGNTSTGTTFGNFSGTARNLRANGVATNIGGYCIMESSAVVENCDLFSTTGKKAAQQDTCFNSADVYGTFIDVTGGRMAFGGHSRPQTGSIGTSAKFIRVGLNTIGSNQGFASGSQMRGFMKDTDISCGGLVRKTAIEIGQGARIYNCTFVNADLTRPSIWATGSVTAVIAHSRINNGMSAYVTNSISTPYNIDDPNIDIVV